MEHNPESVMLHSGLEAGLAAAFLHENMLHFFGDGAIEDAALACDYLGSAGGMGAVTEGNTSS